MNKYVISVKQIKAYGGYDLKDEEQTYHYAKLDNFGGVIIDTASFGDYENHAEFNTPEEAKDFYIKHKDELRRETREHMYDWNTLAIRKIKFKIAEKL